MYDVVIVGGGPAGMTAAVYAARKKLKILLVTSELGGQVLWTEQIENYMGFEAISGPELVKKFEEQIARFPVDIVYDAVNSLQLQADKSFRLCGNDGDYHGKTVIMATGKRPRRLGVPGEDEFRGRGVAFCVTCDGPFFAGKTVAVIGGGNSGVQAALELSHIAERVYLLERNRLLADPVLIDKLYLTPNIVIMEGYFAKSIGGDQAVEKLVIAGPDGVEDILAVQGVFVEIGLEPNSGSVDAILLNERQEIIVDCHAKTSIPGLFAAGDVTIGPDKQIVIAAGDGARAALGAYTYLLRNS